MPKCKNLDFSRLEESNGTHLALFFMCVATDTVLDPFIVPKNFAKFEGDKWKEYKRLLKEAGRSEDSFYEGVTDIRKIFGENLTETTFGKYCTIEKERLEKLPGTLEQRERWGESEEYTTAVYNELDRQYANRIESYSGMTLTPQMEDTLQKVCVWNYKIGQYVENGNIKAAKDLQSMVETALASEQMRKKDEKPVEALRIDALIVALENKGLMKNGQFLTYDETVEALRDNFIKSQKFDYSLDVVDQVIMDVLNSMRANADLPMLTELPEEYAVEDIYGECLPEETEREKAAKRFAGLTNVVIAKSQNEVE